MEVILLERIERLGQMGDVVKVKDGYARNYLLPEKKALRASKANLERFETDRTQLEAENLERRGEAEAVAAKMAGLTVVMVRQAGDTGQLYGSVNARDIAGAVTSAGFTLNRGQVVMDRVIKILGLHPIRVSLHPEVSLQVKVNVARSEEEARLQAAGVDVTATDRDIALEAPEVEEIFEEDAVAEAERLVEDEASEAGEETTGEAAEDSTTAAAETPEARPDAGAGDSGGQAANQKTDAKEQPES